MNDPHRRHPMVVSIDANDVCDDRLVPRFVATSCWRIALADRITEEHVLLRSHFVCDAPVE